MIVSDAAEKLFSIAKKNTAVVFGNYEKIDDNYNNIADFSYKNYHIIENADRKNKSSLFPKDKQNTIMQSVLGGLLSREFLVKNNIYFNDKIIFCEDCVFWYLLMYYCDKFVKTDSICYLYRIRNGSVCHSYNDQRRKHCFLAAKKCISNI